MDTVSSYWNIILFVITTIVYYLVFKPKLTVDILGNEELYAKYNKTYYFVLTMYFLAVVVIQFLINIGLMASKCGGSMNQNVADAAFITFLPWFFLFGAIIVILIVFPGFKSAFSDVLGYFFVAGSANKILTEILMNPEIEEKIDAMSSTVEPSIGQPSTVEPSSTSGQPYTPSSAVELQNQLGGTVVGDPLTNNPSENSKKSMQQAADAIVKLMGNMSILINQMTPSNFNQYWDILKPLMKPGYQDNLEKKQELLTVVESRSNIGEGFWYGYTALLLSSIIQYNIAVSPCTKDAQAVQASYKQYVEQEEKNKAQQEKAQTTYTLK
jgi:hypothetical protein